MSQALLNAMNSKSISVDSSTEQHLTKGCGAATTLVYRYSHFLRDFDAMLSEQLGTAMAASGVR
jgi:hypothetical protein